MKAKKTSEQYGLERNSFPRNKRWAVDQDYVRDLSAEEAKWLGRFNQEFYRKYINATDPNALHNTPELRRDLSSRENAANRDTYAICNSTNQIYLDPVVTCADGHTMRLLENVADAGSEDAIIQSIDEKLKTETKTKH